MHFLEEFKSGKWISNTVAVCAGVAFYLILTHLSIIGVAFSSVWNLIAPLAIGVILAYIIDPAVKFFEGKGLKRRVSVVITLVIILVVVLLLFASLVPQLVNGIMQFLNSISGYITSLEGQIMQADVSKTGGMSSLTEGINDLLDQISNYFSTNSILQDSSGVGSSVGSSVTSFAIGVIFAIYFLMGKASIVKWAQQLCRKVLKDQKYEEFAQFCTRCNDILLRYIICSLIEALIVGLVNLVFMLIFRMPYSNMISCIVGVTNLAPTFGPVIGCLLGMFILLLAKPGAIIWFLIFTLILQTIDGYIIKPKLFGNTLGVSPMLILIVLVIGGRMFGIWGLLLAIPSAAILQFSVQDYLFPFTENRFGKENRRQRSVARRKRLGGE